MFGAYGNIILFILFVPCLDAGAQHRLNQYISHYETLSYNREELAEKHNRAKRSAAMIGSDEATAEAQSDRHHVHFRFTAHNRQFHIRLKRDLTSFSDNLVIVDSNNLPASVDTSHIYHGHLIGEPGSIVFGSILDGLFEGKIVSPLTGAYYVEKSSRYFPEHKSENSNATFHSIVYKDSDTQNPHQHEHSEHFAGCGINDEVKKWMESIQTSAVEEEPPENFGVPKFVPSNNLNVNSTHKKEKRKKIEKEPDVEFYQENPFEKYSERMNIGNENYGYRSKRQVIRPREKDKNTCSLFIQTDPLIWKHIVSEQVNGDPEKAREEILSLIAHHVTAVNYIYRDTKFDGRLEHRNIKFEVQRIKIDDDMSCLAGDHNPFCMENIDVSNFLNLHSLGNHEAFCLAYVFTYRDFTGGTLGLAWVASASGASGGICEKYKTYTETIGGMYQSTKRSLNTGIITFVNYNTRVPPKVSQLTLAHEIGHNFGSPHDYPVECRPGGLSGNYIMFASATSGDRPNNSKFSPCSIGNISSVLDSFGEKKNNCFKASEGAFCGNKIVEEGEECDCGYDEEECNDRCCYPRMISFNDSIMNSTAKGCARKAHTECSPSQGPCCFSNTCKFVPRSRGIVCKTESECSLTSVCNGTSSECPVPPPKPNKTRCNEGTQVCLNGECRGSICLEWGLNVCFLSSNTLPHVDKRKLCELACMNGTNPNSCRSTSEFAAAVGLPPGGISLRPGSPCDNFQGYCDVFFKCRPVDAEGPLARLKNTVFNRKTLLTVQQWVIENWWACMLMGVGFMVVMAGFIKCCAVHTPSSNPKKAPARRFSETLRRPISTLRRMKGPHAHHATRGQHHGVHQYNHRSGHSGGGGGSRHIASASGIDLVPYGNDQPPPPYSQASRQQYHNVPKNNKNSHRHPTPSAPAVAGHSRPHRDRSRQPKL